MAAPSGVLQELNSLLQTLQTLKAPGVNRSKVDTITSLCTDLQNTTRQVPIADTIITNYYRSPPTHRLGVMYIVDSVTRQWKAQGLTWVGGINKITEAIPNLINDLIQVAPDNQKEKVAKLIEIWRSMKTFPDHVITNLQAAFTAATQGGNTGTAQSSQGLALPASSNNQFPAPTANGTNGAAPQPSNPAATALLAALGNFQQPGMPQPPGVLNSASVNQQPVNAPAPAPIFPAAAPQPPASNQNALASLLNGGTQAPAIPLANQVQLLQGLAAQLNPDQLATIIKMMGIQLPAVQPQGSAVPPPPFPSASAPPQPQFSAPDQGNQYRGGYDDRSRARSRSPDYNRRYSPPNRRNSPSYGVYDPSGANMQSSQADNDRRGRGKGRGFRNDYRQRSPPLTGRDRPITPQGIQAVVPRSNMPKPMGYDPKIPSGKIRVLSRTLFVGGVSAKTNETELMDFFSRFGTVQSCIVNHDKRHAFLKLISHQDAHATKQAVDMLPNVEYRGMFERIGWAVGFGPTAFADYQQGTSELPINVLTDADRKWMLTAEYGGTGGKQIETGMIVEEPDIEIGAGPSSKAISRRGGGQGGRGGGNFNQRRGYERHAPYRKPDDRRQGGPPPATMSGMTEPNTLGAPPAVPTFGAPIPGLPMNFR